MNHRRFPRLRRRLKLKLGQLHGFTADVSPAGFGAELMQVVRPGATVSGAIELGGEEFPFTGTVCWARQGEARMNVRGRFGVRFTGIPNTFLKLLELAYRPLASTPA